MGVTGTSGTVRTVQVEQDEGGKRKRPAVGIDAIAFKVADRVLDRVRGLKGIQNSATLEHNPDKLDIIGTIVHHENGLSNGGS